MRIFVTGATGFIGSAVVGELIGAGHQVLGLARSDASAAALTKVGAEVHRGSLQDLDSLKSGVAASDGVIHTAFVHDFSDFANSLETDRRAIETLGVALVGSDRPFVNSSGVMLLAPPGQVGTEDEAGKPGPGMGARRASEIMGLEMASQGVRTSVIRLSPSVHGEGDYGFVPMLVDIARQKGFAAYVGDGQNRWPTVHRLDAARLYRLALEKGEAGSRFHGVADEGVPFRDIAQAIGEGLSLPVRSLSAEEASAYFDWMAHFIAVDNPSSSTRTQERLGWQPTEVGLLGDLAQGHYFSGK